MTASHQRTVQTLIEALPCIRRFQGATMVAKYGGAAMTSAQLAEQFAKDIVLLKLVGKVNKDIVGLINTHGGTAVGLSGQDGRLIRAQVKEHRDLEGNLLDLGFVGSVKSIDTTVLDLLADEMIPVVAGVAADDDGQAFNINADTVAGELAAAADAEKIVFLTDVGGILEDDDFEQDVVSACDLAYLGALQGAGKISGGMLPKVAAVRRALESGVASAPIVDGRVEHAVLLEVLTDAGCGTKVTP